MTGSTAFQPGAQSEEQYRLLFDRNPDGVFSVDPAGRFLVVNAACERISGYSCEELRQRTFAQLCAPDRLPDTLALFQENLRQPQYAEIETAFIRKDGTRGPGSDSPQTGWVRIWVEDQGVGIPATLLPRIFNMFTRGTNDQAGTGIGLALVRKVLDRMGGRVGVESQEGQGSRFWIELAPAS